MTGGPERYRAAEKLAKERKVRLWRNYTATTSTISAKVTRVSLLTLKEQFYNFKELLKLVTMKSLGNVLSPTKFFVGISYMILLAL